MSQFKDSKVNGNGWSATDQWNPQVVQRAKRRQFSVADKLRILAEADGCSEPGRINLFYLSGRALGTKSRRMRSPSWRHFGDSPLTCYQSGANSAHRHSV